MAGRRHYLTLDALRGVAALAVMLYHRREWLPGGVMLNHAWLAVDFFFMLSGFVIAAAYEDRLRDGSMSFLGFARVRAIRLYPLIVLGALAGFGFLLAKAVLWQGGQGIWEAFFQLPCGLLAVPCPPVSPNIPMPFETNNPTWSLFFELAVNAVFALTVRRLGMKTLIAVVLASLAWVSWTELYQGKFPGGFLFDGLIEGIPRTTLPFFIGVLLHRLHKAKRLPIVRAGPIILSIALVLVFAPHFHNPRNFPWYLFAVLIAFPVLIVVGVAREPTGWIAKASAWSGAISYPVYIVHFNAFLWFLMLAGMVGWKPGDGNLPFYLAANATAFVAALLALYLYDQPVRKWLNARRR